VRKADSLDWPEETISNATFTTEGGLQVSVETMKVPSSDDPETMVTWSRLAFDLAPEAEAEDAAPSSGEESGAAEAQDEGPSRADLEAELAELRAATEGWAYALPTWKETSFRLRPEGVMEPAPEPEPEPEEGAAPLGATGSGAVDPVPLKLTPPPEGGGI
jgi:hypothetical protein